MNPKMNLSDLEKLTYDDINFHRVSIVGILMALIKEIAELKKAFNNAPEVPDEQEDT